MREELLKVRWQYAVTVEDIEDQQTETIRWRDAFLIKHANQLVCKSLGFLIILIETCSEDLGRH